MRRRPSGGRIDRARPLTFSFDGTEYGGYVGDTLASALLANGVRVVARSIYRGRPRGVFSAGTEEPNAAVEVELGGASESLLRATRIELAPGLVARSSTGHGRTNVGPDPARYDKRYAHCDLLVVGGGPAGLAAAWAAGRTGARVILVDEDFELGGGLLAADAELDGRPAREWLGALVGELRGRPEVRLLTRSTALGCYDDNLVLVAERRTDHLGPAAPRRAARQRLWQIRAGRVILATGAHERPLLFADNDRPGVMLAGAARAYANRFAVAPGERAVLFTNNDSAYPAALDLLRAGLAVAAVVDLRPRAGAWAERVLALGIPVHLGAAVVGTRGEPTLAGVDVAALDPAGEPIGPTEPLTCDLLAVSGGFNPVLNLHSQAQGRTRYDERLACFVPDGSSPPERVVGAATGIFSLGEAIRQGLAAGAAAAAEAGFAAAPCTPPTADAGPEAAPGGARWLIAAPDGSWDRHFVDLERDATVEDLARATRAGLRSIEHLKRYTTIGTGSDQGKTAGLLAAGVAATLLGAPVGSVGTSNPRPPYTPVAFGLLAGRNQGDLLDPIRVTPIHRWHVEHGAVFENVGQWKRPRYYPRPGEDLEAAVLRECRAARQAVGLIDVSTLGKIELQGPDAAQLLNRIYTGRFDRLAVGAIRYGLICKADGMVFDDGVVMRLAEDRFLATTTTGNAGPVLDWMEEWLQTEWPGLRVRLTSVTEQWATAALVGPRSRDVLRAVAPDLALGPDELPFLTLREGTVAGLPARICRITFSGELAFEINVPRWHGLALWEALVAAGADHGLTTYGTEAMHVLRAEKGYVIVGQDSDGTVTPDDLGLGWLVNLKKGDFVGRRSLFRSDTSRPDRRQLVGLLPLDPNELLPEGAQLVFDPDQPIPMTMEGYVTSSYRSAALGRTFALALVRRGRERHGALVFAPLADRVVAARITEPVFYDPENLRRDG